MPHLAPSKKQAPLDPTWQKHLEPEAYLRTKEPIPYPDFGKLLGVGREGGESLVLNLVAKIRPQHVGILSLHVQKVVSNPFWLVHFCQRLEQGLAGSMKGCNTSAT